jgi:hypothetical protein
MSSFERIEVCGEVSKYLFRPITDFPLIEFVLACYLYGKNQKYLCELVC